MIFTVHITKIPKKSIITEHMLHKIFKVEVTIKHAYYVQKSLCSTAGILLE
jgi:hypothetical protein